MHSSDLHSENPDNQRVTPEVLSADFGNNLFEALVNSCAGSIYVVCGNRIVFHNPQFEQLTGYNAEEVKRMEFVEIVHPKDRKLIKLLFSNNFQEISQKTSRSFTFRALHKNGEMRWFKSNVSIVSWNGQPALLDNCFDITQQKEFERKLVEEEQNFRLLVNGFEDMVFIISKRGMVVQANRSVYNRMGMDEHEIVLKSFSSFFEKSMQDEAKHMVSDAFFGKRMILSGNLVRGNGKLIPVEVRLFKGNWSQKEVVFAICQDISLRIEAERIVKLSEEKFSKAFDNNAVMMVISSFDEGRFIDVNETFLKITGLTREQVVGSTSRELNIFPDIKLRNQLKEMILSEGRVLDAETSLVNSLGQRVLCSFSAEIIDIQGEKCLLFVITDITDKKLAQEKILQSEQRFRQLAELLPEKVFEANANGFLTFANNYLKLFFGFAPNSLEQGIHIADLFSPKDKPKVRSYLKRSSTIPELPSVELVAQKLDGSHFPALTHIIAVIEDKKVSRFMGVMVDITSRKRQELELIKARDEAEQASKAKERFLSTMSHEIRTPMNAVIGMANILLQDNPLAHQMEYLQNLKYSAQGLMSLLNDILDFSKIEAGKLTVNRHPTDLSEIAKGVYNMFKHLASKKGVDIILDYDSTLPNNVQCDSGKLNQILTNLTSNAIKFTLNGSVTIQIAKERETNASVWVRFAVLDTGIGIPLDKHDLIFQEFTQANPNTTRQFGGTGLGLAISHKLVDMLKGNLQVLSQPGKGSEFYFSICLRKIKEPRIKTVDKHNEAVHLNRKRQPYRVLVVEDNEVNSFIALKFLKDWGLETQLAENGAIAVDMVKENEYDLILMDLEMPEMSGYEATQIIRKLPDKTKSQIPIIALTASAMLDVQEKIFKLGMNGFILKPFNPADLKAKISELIKST
ncbi:MAG: PAS domain S-box protein [Tenuifilaceae bacterium]|jgi:PAS domain S-box-containing protein|nr:PAS domain S-box protein [Tenuifilaceae bacterium]